MPDETVTGWPAVSIEQANALLSQPGVMFETETLELNGAPVRCYKNAPSSLRHVFEASAAFGDREFLIYEDERVSFAAHARAVEHFAHALKDTYGIRPGDRVAIIMRNYPQWSVAFWAAIMIGAISTPMNSWWIGEELEYGLADSGARVAVVDEQIFERIRGHWTNLSDLEAIIIARDRSEDRGDSRVTSMETAIGEAGSWKDLPARELPAAELGPETDATIMYTSGTTGKPKGALATHRAIISNIFNSLACQARMFIRRGEMPPEPDPDEQRSTLLAIPFFHATGAFAVLAPAMMQANKIVTMYKWDTGKALEIIQKERITAVGGVPAIAWQILEHPDRDKYDLSSITAVSYGGAPSAPELVTTIRKTFRDAAIGNGWGMTETCATATLNIGEDYVNRPTSAGAAPPAVELKTVRADGSETETDEVGELWVRGPMNCKLYWQKPEATATTFVDGWVITGDLAKIDDEGFLYLVDRAKDMLIRGGENIYSSEVENALYDHPAVMDAAVVGIPHKVLGEEVGAIVQLKPGKSASEDELRAHVAGQLAAFKVPVEILFQDEPLPRNANGKILKMELRERFTPRG